MDGHNECCHVALMGQQGHCKLLVGGCRSRMVTDIALITWRAVVGLAIKGKQHLRHLIQLQTRVGD